MAKPKGPLQGDGHPDEDEEGVPALTDAHKYPNLTAMKEMDRLEHVKRAREMGATRNQASEHASEEVGDH